MSPLDQHRGELTRARAAVSREKHALLALNKKLVAKRSEAGRAKNPTRQAASAREITRLEHNKLNSEKRLAALEKKVHELTTKVGREEVQQQLKAAQAQKRREAEEGQRTAIMKKALTETASHLHDLSSRVVDLETGLIERVREDVWKDVTPRQRDVFLSHSSADSEFARLLYRELVARELDVWFDEAELRLGESVMRQIDLGIAQSRCGVLLITDAFLAGRFWTEREMAALVGGRRRVIPVLSGVSFSSLAAYSPILSDFAGLDADLRGLDEVADQIAAALREKD